MIDKVQRFCETAEDVTDELTSAAGSIVTKATPLLAPLASGATVLFSVYDGVGRMIDGMIGHPYAVSFAVGFVLAMVNPSHSYAAMSAADVRTLSRPTISRIRATRVSCDAPNSPGA